MCDLSTIPLIKSVLISWLMFYFLCFFQMNAAVLNAGIRLKARSVVPVQAATKAMENGASWETSAMTAHVLKVQNQLLT